MQKMLDGGASEDGVAIVPGADAIVPGAGAITVDADAIVPDADAIVPDDADITDGIAADAGLVKTKL